jgi:hypothetical protein
MTKLNNDKTIIEEITLAEFSERFLHNNDFKTPAVYDLRDFEIEVETIKGESRCFVPIKSFIVKPSVSEYYSDGNLNGTNKHRVIENEKEVHLEDHNEFKKINMPMDVVDIEVDGETYLANGRLNHNTTSGGKALAFHSSVRLRLSSIGKLKKTINGKPVVIGVKTKAVVIKNRMGPPHRYSEFDIYFDRGIDDYSNWIQVLKDNKIITGAKTPYKFEREDGSVANIDKDIELVLSTDVALKSELRDKICDALIFKYRDPNAPIDDSIEHDTSDTDDVGAINED